MQGRRDNIHKARIKIIVHQMGIDKFRELVDKEWELTKNGVLKVPDDEIERIRAYFAAPAYERSRWEPSLVRAIDERYRLVSRSPGGLFVYRPR
jgi:sulfite reductase (NADPH) hemoprotein beta-component